MEKVPARKGKINLKREILKLKLGYNKSETFYDTYLILKRNEKK